MATDKIKECRIVSKLVKDPNTPPETWLLAGYVGRSSLEGHTRLYHDATLNDWVDIPDDAILHMEDWPTEGHPWGGKHVWVQRKAPLVPAPYRSGQHESSPAAVCCRDDSPHVCCQPPTVCCGDSPPHVCCLPKPPTVCCQPPTVCRGDSPHHVCCPPKPPSACPPCDQPCCPKPPETPAACNPEPCCVWPQSSWGTPRPSPGWSPPGRNPWGYNPYGW